MIGNYFKITFRNLRRQKGYSLINIIGLAIGIACCILMLLYVQDELSYDHFHEKSERIHRVVLDARIMDKELEAPVSPAPMAATLRDEFPEIESSTRLFGFSGKTLIRYQDRQFIEEKLFFADSTLFDIFSIKVVAGDARTALARPNSLVLTEALAEKYFGSDDPIGQTVIMTDTFHYQITAVIEALPHNSHVHFDALASLSSLPQAQNTFWISNNFMTYLLLREGATAADVEAKFPALVAKYAGPQLQQTLGIDFEQFEKAGSRYSYYLQPITAIHLHSNLEFEAEGGGNMAYVYIFSATALFILLIAGINFMNLSTARSANRSREVGIRKVMGSLRGQLIGQFLGESVIVSILATVVAIGLIFLALPYFNQLAAKEISFSIFGQGDMLAAVAAFAIVVGLLAGSYPALFLSAFRPIAVLRGKLRAGAKSSWLRNGLVIFQFAISIILIIGTMVVYQQLDYLQHRQLGWDREHLLVVERATLLDTHLDAFKHELKQQGGILHLATSSSVPGEIFGQTAYQPEGVSGNQTYVLSPMLVDADFFETYDLQLADGRAFSRDFLTDSSAFILNEAGVKMMGLVDPVGKRLKIFGGEESGPVSGPIVGVLKDFHFQSLHQPIGALALSMTRRAMPFITIRIAPGEVQQALTQIEETWTKFVADQPLTYYFMDQRFDSLYRAEQRLGTIFTTFSALAIFIACLGLFGLASFTTEQRTREIGLRKVLGASIGSILMLLSREITLLVIIAFVVAVPVSYYVMMEWLQAFAYRTDPSPLIFLLSGILAMIIALLTIGYQALRAALSNPAQALRHE